MGYRVKDICYSATQDALVAFTQLYPMLGPEPNVGEAGTIHTVSINSTGRITYQLVRADQTTTGNKYLQLQECTTASTFKDTPIRDIGDMDMMIVIACIFALLIGFGHGMSLRGFGK